MRQSGLRVAFGLLSGSLALSSQALGFWQCTCCEPGVKGTIHGDVSIGEGPELRARGIDRFGSRGSPTQFVFLDFDSGSDGTINYTPAMRTAIRDSMNGHYSAFNVQVTNVNPGGVFSTITFNAGSPGGLAQQIDFGNVDFGDTAVVNIDGLGIGGVSNIISASSIIGSHELGHLLGLRHHDSMGPIGSGITPALPSSAWLPSYPGPLGGDETNDHIMASPGSVGQPLSAALTPSWLSERAAVKLAFNEMGTFIGETPGPKGSIGTAQPISLANMTVPNTIVSGDNAGLADFSVDALSVTGTLSFSGESDFYSFTGNAGDLINIEVMSGSIAQQLGATIDPQISVFDSLGNFVDYYGTNAFNDDELEGLDSQILDLFLPANDTYYLKVNAFSAGDTGNYELFVNRFNGVIPAPAGVSLVGLGLLAIRRRRR